MKHVLELPHPSNCYTSTSRCHKLLHFLHVYPARNLILFMIFVYFSYLLKFQVKVENVFVYQRHQVLVTYNIATRGRYKGIFFNFP